MGLKDDALREQARRELAKRGAQKSLEQFCILMDPQTYIQARHAKVLIQHLEALEAREIENLIVQMPPRSSKSYHVSERFPAWILGKRGACQLILAGNSAELAQGSSRTIRGLVSDERYPFRARIRKDSSAVNRWQTTEGGKVIAAGVGTAITGQGADVLIIDDPVKDREEIDSPLQRDKMWDWYTDAARTRCMPGSAQLVTMTRWHDDDLTGRILNSKDAHRWTVISFPALAIENDILGRQPGEALWPEWYPVDTLLATKAILSSRSWASLYQQSPVPDDGSIFRSQWFTNRYDQPPQRFTQLKNQYGQDTRVQQELVVVQSIDSAWKDGPSNDYSVIATWGATATDYYLLDIWRDRVEYPTLCRMVAEQAIKWKPHAVYVEDAASGTGIIQQFKHASGVPVIGVKPSGSKESRADTVTPMFEAGKVVLPKESPWIDEWIQEHLRFPAAAHDDQVDTTSLALSQLMKRTYKTMAQTSSADLQRQLSGWMTR